uniref:Uncharacterized protein n=1 Tax=Panagrolaimus sp. ES5 TaxID=591445 RepID=A0AC34FRP5_9BILA
MLHMVDLNSFAGIRDGANKVTNQMQPNDKPSEPPPSTAVTLKALNNQNEMEPKGILRNNINKTTNQFQPKNAYPPPTTSTSAAATVNQKQQPSVRARSASIQSRKSTGNGATDDEKNNQNPREHPRKTVVAFGRTTKVDETIKNIRAAPNFKAPIGSSKDILDLRNIVEHQTAKLQIHQEEIQVLKKELEAQHEKYCYLLDSNSKLWSAFSNLEKKLLLSSTTRNIDTKNDVMKYEHVMAKEKTKQIACVSNIEKPMPKDSIAVKKFKEKNAETEKVPKKNINVEEQCQSAPQKETTKTPTVKLAPAPEREKTFSAVERFLNANPNHAKDVLKLTKDIQKKKNHETQSGSKEKDDRKINEQNKDRHQKSKDKNVVETIALERKIYEPKNIRNYLSSTIDDTFEKLGIKDRNQHQQQNRRPSPTTPTIHEVTSSSQHDDYLEQPPKFNHRHGGTNRKSTLQATNMPDHFDDEDMSSDTEVTPQLRNIRRVANRMNDRRR